MEIAIGLYPQFTALDCIGPYDVLSRLPGARVHWLAATAGPVQADAGLLIHAHAAFAEHPRPDVLLIPGGMRVPTPDDDADLFAWVESAQRHARWTVSVCSGALVLGQLGLLRGLRATTHWSEMDSLSRYGAIPAYERVILHDRIALAAGVSAGIDLALSLAERLADRATAEAIQLAIEYDPQPPYDTGDARRADETLKAAATTRLVESVVPAQFRGGALL